MLNIEKYKEEINEAINDRYVEDILCEINENIMGERPLVDCCYSGSEMCENCHKNVMKWLLEEYKEPIKPILTEKEKAYLKNVIEPYGNNTAYVCRFITETLRKEFLSICINVDENSINSFEIPLIHGLKTWYKNMVLDKEYTLEELGL